MVFVCLFHRLCLCLFSLIFQIILEMNWIQWSPSDLIEQMETMNRFWPLSLIKMSG